MIEVAGSIRTNVALIATHGKCLRAIIAPHRGASFRYIPSMTKMHEWVREARDHSGLSGAELSRRLWVKLGRVSDDRSLIGKMAKDPEAPGTKPRKTSLEELLALQEITGYPLPEEVRRLAQAPDDAQALTTGRRVEGLPDEQRAIIMNLLDQFDPR